MLLRGLVIKSTGNWYQVMSGTETYPCRIIGKFRLWLEKYTGVKQSAKKYQDIMKKLSYASLKRMPTKEEMNER